MLEYASQELLEIIILGDVKLV